MALAVHATKPRVLRCDMFTEEQDLINGTELSFSSYYRTGWVDGQTYSMKKMFMGSRNYKLNSNLTNVDADDNDVPSWSQDSSTDTAPASANESFDGHRHHGSGETTRVSTSDSNDTSRGKRTLGVLRVMAAMNQDAQPKKKKKKKKTVQ